MKGIYINQKSVSRHKINNCELWDIDGLEVELNDKILPETLKFSSFETISNLVKFKDRHIEIAKHNNGNRTYKPYFERLIMLNNILK